MAAKSQRVEVTRAFRRAGEDIGIGSVLDLDLPTAQELRNAKKVEFVASDTKAAILPFKSKVKAPPQPDLIAALTAQVAALAAEIASLKAAKPAAKEKGNA